MLYQFKFGKSLWGGWRFRNVPVYYMLYWQPGRNTQDRIVYRPSTRTLAHLVGISGMALILLVLSTCFAGFPWVSDSDQAAPAIEVRAVTDEEVRKVQEFTERLKKHLSPDARAELERKSSARAQSMQDRSERNESVRQTGHLIKSTLYWLMYLGLFAVMVFPLGAYPFEWLEIQRSGNDLVVRKRGIWPVTRRWPLGTFGQILCYVDAERQRSPGTVSTVVGWRWMVKLTASAEVWAEREASLVDHPEVVFFVDYQKMQPSDTELLPGSVSTLISHLQRLTGIEAVVRGEVSVEHSLLGGDRITHHYPMVTHSKVTRRVVGSLDDVPEDLRPAAEEMLRESTENKRLDAQHSFHATFRDRHGNTIVYNSLDEMPPKLRARHEEALRQAEKTRRR